MNEKSGEKDSKGVVTIGRENENENEGKRMYAERDMYKPKKFGLVI